MKKSYMKWSWMIMIAFLVAGIIDIRFGIFGTFAWGHLYITPLGGGVKLTVPTTVQGGLFLAEC